MSVKRLARLSVLTALALILFVIEGLFPPLFIPGAKMGVSNIITLLVLFTMRPVDALTLVAVRTTLGSLFSGGMSSLMYSLPAGLVSTAASILLIKCFFPRISMISVSIAAAVLHNLTQNAIYCLITNTPQMMGYMPYLALIGVVAGLITGMAVYLAIRAIPLPFFRRMLAG